MSPMALDPTDPRLARLLTAGTLGAGAMHELRNTLAVVASSLYLARRDRADEARLLAHLDRATRELAQAQGAAEAILTLARGEPLPLEPCRPSAILAAARGLVSIPPSIAFSEHVPPEDPPLRAHPLLLPQALAALYLNAIEAQRDQERGALRVVVRLQEAHQEVLIEDDGPGIPDDAAASIFDPLVTDKPTGTGLGLPVVRAIVEAHGGQVRLVPAPRGARFSVLLPA